MSRVYILLVNWNGWAETLECLESLLRLAYDDFRIVVVDNASTDRSNERLAAWGRGDLDLIQIGPLSEKSRPSTGRRIEMAEYTQVDVESGCHEDEDPFLTIIRAKGNLGFAGGNNVGFRYIQGRKDAAYVWLLNNDTVVTPVALSTMVARMKSDPGIGMCGSSLLFYEQPTHVQALGGGYYFRWLAVAWHLGQRRRFSMAVQPGKVERYLSYVTGASMLVSIDFLNEVGLMAEDYFLYFEEMDWALRAGKRFRSAYAPESIVYHKVGRSIGTRSHPGKKSLICDYYNLRNRIIFTRRYFPGALFTVYCGLLVETMLRLLFGQWGRARMILCLISCGKSLPPLSRFEDMQA